MKLDIKDFYECTVWLTATVDITGSKDEGSVITRLLQDVSFAGHIIRDHSWVHNSKIDASKGDVIRFRATINRYESLDKGYFVGLKFGLRKICMVKVIGTSDKKGHK